MKGLSAQARFHIRVLFQSLVTYIVQSLQHRPICCVTLFLVVISCYSSALFRGAVFDLLAMSGLWNLLSSDSHLQQRIPLTRDRVLGLFRGVSLPTIAKESPCLKNDLTSPSKLQFTEAKPATVTIPLATKTEKPLNDFISSLCKVVISPILSNLSSATDSPLLGIIESALTNAFSEIGRRSAAFDFPHFVSAKLVPIITHHIRDCRLAAVKASKLAVQLSKEKNVDLDEQLLIKCFKNGNLHPALSSWYTADLQQSQHKMSEIEHLKKMMRGLLPVLFEGDVKSNIFYSFMVEVLANKVLKVAIDNLSDSDYWYQLFDSETKS
ncbi:PXA domain-containing protein [Chytriomyces sp. MP71]|nr:PXA domain-containing protein [Chytriomyces sp. MP71]